MEPYEVIWSRESIYDAADIAESIELNFGQERSDKFNDDIDKEVEALSTRFKHHTDTGIYYRGYLIFKKNFHPSLIFFFVDNQKKTVYVIRILRHERNWQKILRETISYTFD